MEDVAIAYGYNNIEKTVPKMSTVGDQVREQRKIAGPKKAFISIKRKSFAFTNYLTVLFSFFSL